MLDVWIKEEGRMAELPVHGIGGRAYPFGYDWVLKDLYCVDDPPVGDLPDEAGTADWVFDSMEEAEWAASVLEKVCPVCDLYQNELSQLGEDEFWGVYEDAMGSESFDAFDKLRVKAYGQLCAQLSSDATNRLSGLVSEAASLVETAGIKYPSDALDVVVYKGVSLGASARSVLIAANNLEEALVAVGAGGWDLASARVARVLSAETGCLYAVAEIDGDGDGILGKDMALAAKVYLAAWRKVQDAAFYVDGEVRRCMERLVEVREALGL